MPEHSAPCQFNHQHPIGAICSWHQIRNKCMSLQKLKHTTMPADWRIGKWWPIGPRVEDPVRIKLLSEAISSLTWDSQKTRQSLAVVFDQLSILAHAELRYYYMRRKAAGKRATFFRICAWSLGTAGLLIPLAQPLLKDPPSNLLAWGYLAIATAGAFVVADTVFSGTEGQARYVITQLDLERQYTQFSLEWQALLIAYDSQPSPESAVALIEKAIGYAESFHKALASETAEWKETMAKVKAELKQQSAPTAQDGGAV